MTVFDVNKQTIVGDVKDLKHVHGVLAVPELHRVYASATGTSLHLLGFSFACRYGRDTARQKIPAEDLSAQLSNRAYYWNADPVREPSLRQALTPSIAEATAGAAAIVATVSYVRDVLGRVCVTFWAGDRLPSLLSWQPLVWAPHLRQSS